MGGPLLGGKLGLGQNLLHEIGIFQRDPQRRILRQWHEIIVPRRRRPPQSLHLGTDLLGEHRVA